MKVCFYGNTGHSGTAIAAKEKLPQVDLRACCPSYPGESMENLIKYAGQAGCQLTQYITLNEMLDTEKPDILVVDTLFTERFTVEKEALSRGIHVYADKPVATSVEELESLYHTAKETNTIIWSMHTTRYEPHFYTAKLLVEQGAIGKVRMVNCQKSYRLGIRPFYYHDRKTYCGTIPWVAIHGIDMIRMVTGCEFKSVYSVQSSSDNFGNGGLEMIAISSFEMENDILASVTADYYRPKNAHSHDDDRLRVVGTKGIVEVSRRDGAHEVRLLNDENNGLNPVQQEQPPMLFEDFVHSIEGRGSGILTMRDTFMNTFAAIYAQQSADAKNTLKIGEAEIGLFSNLS